MRRLFTILACFAILLISASPAYAALSAVRDDADLLTAYELSDLEDQARDISDAYDISVVILTVDGLGGQSTWEYADDHFYGGNYGEDGILLLISMEYRDWEIATYGFVASMIPDSETEDLFDAMADDLADNDFYAGFSAYLRALDRKLSGADKPYSRNQGLQILVSVVIGAVVALVALLVMRGRMNTVRAQRAATNYLKQGSYQLTSHRDLYLYSNTTKTRRSQNNGSGGGHGGGSRGGSRGKF